MQSRLASLLASFTKSGTKARSLSQKRQVRLGFECLEGRDMLSATVSSVPIGTLYHAMTADRAVRTLAVNVNQNVVPDKSPMPTSYPYYVQIDHEVMQVTTNAFYNITSPVNEFDFTVNRAADGTTLVAHPAGEPVYWLQGYQPATHLSAPTGFTAKAVSSSQINLSWNGVIGTNGYVIDQWNPSTKTWQDIRTVGGATMATSITGLKAGTIYYFEVRGFNDAGQGDFTNYQSAATFAAARVPGTPANFTVTAVSKSQINVAWSGVTGASGYRVYEYTSTGWQAIATTAGTAYQVSGLKASTTYYFEVAAYNAAGTGKATPVKSATTFAATLTPPANFTATAVSKSQINLAWSGVTGASGYRIYLYTTTGWQAIATTAGTAYQVPGLKAGTTYTFDVAAYNAASIGTAAPYRSATTFKDSLDAPKNFGAKAVSPSQVNLGWSAVAGATGYTVQQYKNGAWTVIANVAGAGYSVTGLSAASTNFFRVAAYNAQITGAYTNYITAVTWPAAPPNFYASAVSSSQANLSWNPVGGITGYVVYYKTATTGWTLFRQLAPGQTSLAVTGLSHGVTYTFDVGAYNAAGTTFARAINVTV